MTDHNPAPWYMEAFGVIPSDGPTKYRLVDSEGVTVGFTYGYSKQDWQNALLMAAAPELLVACEAAQRFLDWPPPRAEDSESTGAHGAALDTLTAAMRLFDPELARQRRGQLDEAAEQLWATPNMQDEKVRETPASALNRLIRGRQQNLADEALLYSLPAPEIAGDGQPSSPSTPASRRRLNPEFVEWLMGWPPGWTDLDSSSSATALSHWSRRMRSWLCVLGWVEGEGDGESGRR